MGTSGSRRLWHTCDHPLTSAVHFSRQASAASDDTLDQQRPPDAAVTIAIADARCGVGKTTSTLILSKCVAQQCRV